MNKFRSHNCNELKKKDVGSKVLLSGWVNKKRDHGNLLFIDLRDNYGITQCIIDKANKNFSQLEKIQLETVISINGNLQLKKSYLTLQIMILEKLLLVISQLIIKVKN